MPRIRRSPTVITNSFTAAWNYTGITAGPPIVAAGAVWVINTSGSTLDALSPNTGALIGSQSLAGGVGHFVTPSEGGGNIYVPGDGYIQAFGIGQWKASYNMSSAPTTWATGQTQTFPVTVTNTGNITWPSTGYTAVELDLHFATSAGGSANQTNWLTKHQHLITAGGGPVFVDRDWVSALAYAYSLPQFARWRFFAASESPFRDLETASKNPIYSIT